MVQLFIFFFFISVDRILLLWQSKSSVQQLSARVRARCMACDCGTVTCFYKNPQIQKNIANDFVKSTFKTYNFRFLFQNKENSIR